MKTIPLKAVTFLLLLALRQIATYGHLGNSNNNTSTNNNNADEPSPLTPRETTSSQSTRHLMQFVVNAPDHGRNFIANEENEQQQFRRLMESDLLGYNISPDAWGDVTDIIHGFAIKYGISIRIRSIREGQDDFFVLINGNNLGNEFTVSINNHPDHNNIGGHFDLPVRFWEDSLPVSLGQTSQPVTSHIPSQQPTQMPSSTKRTNTGPTKSSPMKSKSRVTTAMGNIDIHDSDTEEGKNDAASDNDSVEVEVEQSNTALVSLDKQYQYQGKDIPSLPQPRTLEMFNFSPKLDNVVMDIISKAAESLDSMLEQVVHKYTPVLLNCNDMEIVKDAHRCFRRDVKVVFDKLGYGGLINMGDSISEDTLLLVVLHYATEAEKDIKAGGDHLSKMDASKSSCIAFPKKHIPSSVVREYTRKILEKEIDEDDEARDHWDKIKNKVTSRITTVDHRIIISEDKDTFSTEVRSFVKNDKTTTTVLDILGVINASFHDLYYYLRTGGKKLATIVASTTVFDSAYGGLKGGIDKADKTISNCVGYITHSESWLAGYIRNPLTYTDDLLKYFDGVIAAGFTEIFEQVVKPSYTELNIVENGMDLPEFFTTIARRFALGTMTEQEREDLRLLLLDIRIRGGKTSGLMNRLVFAIISKLMKEDGLKEEEAITKLQSELQKLQQRFENVNDMSKVSSHDEIDTNDAVNAAYIALKLHNPKTLDEDKTDIRKLAVKLAKKYKGSAAGGLMGTLASLLFDSDDDVDSKDVQQRAIATLAGMKTTYQRRTNNEEDVIIESDDVLYVVFANLLKYNSDDAANVSNLVEKLLSCKRGHQIAGHMWKLASKFFGNADVGKLMFGSSFEDIVIRLETLNTERGEMYNEEVVKAFNNLKALSPDIVEDFDSLAMFLYDHSQSLDKTFNKYYKKLNEYIRKHDLIKGYVVVNSEIDVMLYYWWSTQIGLTLFNAEQMGQDSTTFDDNRCKFGIVARTLGKDSKYYDMLNNIEGFCFHPATIKEAVGNFDAEGWLESLDTAVVDNGLAGGWE